MVALGLLNSTPAQAFTLSGQVEGTRIIILGAGLAGMCAAHELGKLGHDCHILEARSRAGGRCWTVRQDTTETEIDGEEQVATFDKDLRPPFLWPGTRSSTAWVAGRFISRIRGSSTTQPSTNLMGPSIWPASI